MTTSNALSKKSMDELNRLSVSALKTVARHNIRVILDNVRSRNNVGSVFRTADAFRIDKIFLCGHTPCPPHRDIFKTALGATETVPWEYQEDIGILLNRLQKEHQNIWAVEQTHNSTPLQDFQQLDCQETITLVFGNEVSGVSENALGYCKGSLEIPQWGNKHSLNIAVSAGIVLWEVVRGMTK